MKKYGLDHNDTILVNGNRTLYRVVALADIPMYNVKAGDRGGYMESERNLSQSGSCWVDDIAMIYENAKISGNAIASGHTIVNKNAIVGGNAKVLGYAKVSDSAKVLDRAVIGSFASVWDSAIIKGDAWLTDHACVKGDASVHGNANLSDSCLVAGYADIGPGTVVYGNAIVDIKKEYDYTIAYCRIGNGAKITSINDVISIKGIGIGSRLTTFFKNDEGDISVDGETFYRSLSQFRERVAEEYDPEVAREYIAAASLAMLHINKDEKINK